VPVDRRRYLALSLPALSHRAKVAAAATRLPHMLQMNAHRVNAETALELITEYLRHMDSDTAYAIRR